MRTRQAAGIVFKSAITLCCLFLMAGCTVNNESGIVYVQVPSNGKYTMMYNLDACANPAYANAADIVKSFNFTYGPGDIITYNDTAERMCVGGGFGNASVFSSGQTVSITADISAVTTNGFVTQIQVPAEGFRIEAYDGVNGINRVWKNMDSYEGPVSQTSTVSMTIWRVLP